MSTAVVAGPVRLSGAPEWVERSLNVKPGRDPLGLQTITEDRIMPLLLPAILVLSQRARYFSVYPFFLKAYQERRLPASNEVLSAFVKAREFEYAVAVQLCRRCEGLRAGAIGAERAKPAAARLDKALERGESVKSFLGGYGLYYRSPLIDLGIVVPRGTALGEETTPVDVVAPMKQAQELAHRYMEAIGKTDYFRKYFFGTQPIPTPVLEELATVGCLCRLNDYPQEQEAISHAFFVAAVRELQPDVDQRRRSFALFLRELERAPDTAYSNGAFREAVWDDFANHTRADGPLTKTLAQWAALAMKEYAQEALSTIWSHFCRLGLAEQEPEGLTPAQLDTLLRGPLVGEGVLEVSGNKLPFGPTVRASAFARAAVAASGKTSCEEIRRWAVEQDSAIAGLVLLFATIGRLPKLQGAPRSWAEIGTQGSDRQPSLLRLAFVTEERLKGDHTLAAFVSWLVRRFVISAHEQIAYAKLPDFTFRFRREAGRLRFYPIGEGRFDPANMRRDAMSRLSEDLGLWRERKSAPALTDGGRRFIREVLG